MESGKEKIRVLNTLMNLTHLHIDVKDNARPRITVVMII